MVSPKPCPQQSRRARTECRDPRPPAHRSCYGRGVQPMLSGFLNVTHVNFCCDVRPPAVTARPASFQNTKSIVAVPVLLGQPRSVALSSPGDAVSTWNGEVPVVVWVSCARHWEPCDETGGGFCPATSF